MGRYEALWGAVGRYGALWGNMGRHEALWGDIRHYGALWGSMGRHEALWGAARQCRGSSGAGMRCRVGSVPQISRAYCAMVRSLENFPAAAMFRITVRVHCRESCRERTAVGRRRGAHAAHSTQRTAP